MFRSFFPMPKVLFISAVTWAIICGVVWHYGGAEFGSHLGLAPTPGAAEIPDVSYFWSNDSLWYYIYYIACSVMFFAFWRWYQPHQWSNWSIGITLSIIFVAQFSVDTSVALNNWRGVFYDLVQKALTGTTKGTVPASELYTRAFDFVQISFVWIAVAVTNSFIVSHWIFRWRTAMNNFYSYNWLKLREIEGASQRVQEDTMRFAETMENLFERAIQAVLTLVAFLPILYGLSSHVTSLPLLGKIPGSLVVMSVAWALFGTLLLMAAGVKLPGLNFRNQRVEAALRKELVYGEDDAARASPPTLKDLFSAVRQNYYRMYFHYSYFNTAFNFYGQADAIFSLVILIPTIAAGAITFGVYQQIRSAFAEVSDALQYLANRWSTIVELLSIHKRLRSFESVIDNEPLPPIDQEWLNQRFAPAA
jgi:peptide/bleomycin uptake transporter